MRRQNREARTENRSLDWWFLIDLAGAHSWFLPPSRAACNEGPRPTPEAPPRTRPRAAQHRLEATQHTPRRRARARGCSERNADAHRVRPARAADRDET